MPDFAEQGRDRPRSVTADPVEAGALEAVALPAVVVICP